MAYHAFFMASRLYLPAPGLFCFAETARRKICRDKNGKPDLYHCNFSDFFPLRFLAWCRLEFYCLGSLPGYLSYIRPPVPVTLSQKDREGSCCNDYFFIPDHWMGDIQIFHPRSLPGKDVLIQRRDQ